MKRLLKSEGSSLIGVLTSAALGFIIIMAIGKAIMNFSHESTKVTRRKEVEDVISNLKTVMRSTQGWRSTIEKAPCIPGQINCNQMIFYFYSGSVENQVEYNALSKQWTINFNKHGENIGVAYFDLKGNIKDPGDCGIPNTLTPSDIEECYKKDQLVKIEIFPPANLIPASVTKPPMPDFVIKYTDLKIDRSVHSTTVYQDKNIYNKPFELISTKSSKWKFFQCEESNSVEAQCPVGTHIINCGILVMAKNDINLEFLSVKHNATNELQHTMEKSSRRCIVNGVMTIKPYCDKHYAAAATCLKVDNFYLPYI